MEDRYFGISQRIAKWKEPSEFESRLGEAAGTEKTARSLYALYYKELNPIYYAQGKELAKSYIKSHPTDFEGYDFESLYTDMVYCLHRYGFSFQDYCIYRLNNKTENEKSEFVSDKLRYYYCDILNAPFVNELMTNKYQCYEVYHKFYRRDVVKCETNSDRADFYRFINKHNKFIYKPMSEHSGHGIEIIDTSEINSDKWFDNTISHRPGIIEELITQGDELNQMNPGSINSCRIVAFTIDEEVTLIGGALRMGQGSNITDNAGSGGIYASIDVETGHLQSDAKDYLNQHYSEHPTTKTKIMGFQLPEWDKAIDLIKRMSRLIKGTTLISWDIAFSDKGWLMVEANDNGDWSIIQSNLEKGMKAKLYELMDRYFANKPIY